QLGTAGAGLAAVRLPGFRQPAVGGPGASANAGRTIWVRLRVRGDRAAAEGSQHADRRIELSDIDAVRQPIPSQCATALLIAALAGHPADLRFRRRARQSAGHANASADRPGTRRPGALYDHHCAAGLPDLQAHRAALQAARDAEYALTQSFRTQLVAWNL